jgi:hypothetical protein
MFAFQDKVQSLSRRWIFSTGLALLLLSGLFGCSGSSNRTETEGSGPPLVLPATTQILLEARLTGVVSEADWKEANENSVRCVIDRGYSAKNAWIPYRGLDAILETLADSSQETQILLADFQNCHVRYGFYVSGLYSYLYGGQSGNKSDDIPQQIYQCLLERNLIPASVNFDEYLVDFETPDIPLYGPERGPGFKACFDLFTA